MVTALGIVGVAADAAVAISVILALTASVASLPGGFVFAFYKLQTPPHEKENNHAA
jgi:gamma-glutamyltranspeptidase